MTSVESTGIPKNRNHMTTHQNGYVTLTGKRQRKWLGHYKEKVNGEWVARTKIVGTKAAMSKGEAKEALAEFIRGPKPKAWNSSMAFADAAAKYIELKSGDWSKGFRDTVKGLFRKHIVPAFDSKVVGDILPTDCKALYNACATSESQLHKVVTHTRAVFEMLLEDGIIARNPARSRTATPPENVKKPCGRYLSLDEVYALLDASDGADYLILRIMFSCALRPSEAFALRVDDIEPGRLRIDEAATSHNGLKDTKTEESDGYVPLSSELENLLRLHVAGRADREFIFPCSTGGPILVNNYLKRQLRDIAERAGVESVTLQCIRRTVATHMQHHGAVKSTQGLLRHANASTTLKHYQKTIPEDVVKASGSWDAMLSTAGRIKGNGSTPTQ